MNQDLAERKVPMHGKMERPALHKNRKGKEESCDRRTKGSRQPDIFSGDFSPPERHGGQRYHHAQEISRLHDQEQGEVI